MTNPTQPAEKRKRGRPRKEPKKVNKTRADTAKHSPTKLNDEQRDWIFKQLAEWKKQEDIASRSLEEIGVAIDRSLVQYYGARYPERVTAAREEYLSSFLDIPLAHTKVRVFELAELYRNAKAEGKRFYQIEALKAIRDEMAVIQVDLNTYGTTKEAEEFIATLEGGQAGIAAVRENERQERAQ